MRSSQNRKKWEVRNSKSIEVMLKIHQIPISPFLEHGNMLFVHICPIPKRLSRGLGQKSRCECCASSQVLRVAIEVGNMNLEIYRIQSEYSE